MREMKDLTYDEYSLIKDCKYQRSFPSLQGNSIYTCCTRNVDDETLKLAPYKYVGVCSDCVGSSCEYKESKFMR